MKQTEGLVLRHIDIGHPARSVRRDSINHLFVSSEAWATTTLGEIADIRNGATPSTHISANWDGSIPWCTPTDITNTPGKYLTETARSITERGLAGCGANLLPAGALLLCSRATIGEIRIASFPICTNQGFKSLVCTKQVHNEFLYYLILTLETRLVQQAIGSTFLEIGKHALSSMEVRLPSLEEQRAIAEALSDVDGLIESLESLIVKKQAVKTAAIQQLLTGKTRLPGFSGTWKRTALGEISDIKNGSTPSTRIPVYWNGRIPWCTPTDITDTPGKYLLATERNITEEGLASCAASLLPVGALLLCSRATIGEIKIAGLRMCTNQGFKSLVCKDGVSNEFLYYLLKTLKPKLIERAIGSTFLEIGKREVESIEVNLPPLDEQRAVATVLSDMDAEVVALERCHDKACALKQGTMQQLLIGRIRLTQPL